MAHGDTIAAPIEVNVTTCFSIKSSITVNRETCDDVTDGAYWMNLNSIYSDYYLTDYYCTDYHVSDNSRLLDSHPGYFRCL